VTGATARAAEAIAREAQQRTADAPASCIEIVRADAIKVEPIRWLWPGWLAAGKLHLIAGEPSAGKTTLALAFAAILSRGGAWPDGSRAPLGSTLIWSGEDDASDSIVPRYLVNGGDRARLHIVRGRIDAAGRRAPFDPGFDMPELTERARGIDGLKFIVIDPIINVAISDSHKAAETRRDLQPVVDMASAVGAAVHGVTHFAKNTSGRKTHERVLGSQAFVALARLVMAAAVPDEDGEPRRLVRCKTNIGPNGDGFEYTLSQEPVPDHPGIYGQRVTFGAALTGRAEVLLREIEKAGGETAAPARDAAADWLRSILARGPIPSSEVKARGREAGFSWETLRDAQRALGIRPCKAGMLAGWVWTLPPPKMATNAEDGHAKPMAIFATDGHLRATGTDAETF